MKCLCCNKELNSASEYELTSGWHEKCIRKFWNIKKLPELDFSEKLLEELADQAVNKGMTVPGVQKKLSVHLDTTDSVARLTVLDFPTGYILKPPSAEYPCLPESEYLVMKMAEAAGIRTVPSALLRTQDSYLFVTKRIDRDHNKLFAMEDFCQLAGRTTADKYKGSYENCGKIIRRYSQNTGLDLAEFYYRLLFCFVTGNSDMHYKNFSLIEKEPGSRIFGLSAAYDLLPVNVILPEDTEETALTLNGKKQNIRKKDFLQLGINLGISEHTAETFIKRMDSLESMFCEMIGESYVEEKMKISLVALIKERIKRLS